MQNKIKYIGMVLLLSSLNAYSGMSCSLLPGTWHGIYTIKDQDLCKKYNGCEHLIRVNSLEVSETSYKANLQFPIGSLHQTIDYSCENGKISLSLPFDYEINSSCNGENKCFISFNSELFYAELANG